MLVLTAETELQGKAFSGGTLYEIAYPLTPPQNITSTGLVTSNQAINKAANRGLLKPLEGVRDLTLFLRQDGTVYGAVTGTVATSASFAKHGGSVQTTSDQVLRLSRSGRRLLVNGTRIAQRDILVNSGVVHVLA